MSEKKNVSIREKLQKKVKALIDEVTKTRTPASLEIMSSDNWTLQLLVVPPSTVTYGATTVRRESPAVLLSIRSSKLWRNNITIKSRESFEDLVNLIEEFKKDKELYDAVLDSITTREARPVKRVIVEEL